MSKRPSELRPEWDALQQEAAGLEAEPMAPSGPEREAQEARLAMLVLKQEILAAAAWLGEARDFADVLLLAEIAWDLFDLGTFPNLPPEIEDADQRHLAIAYLCRGVFTASQAQAGTNGGTP